MQEKKPNWQEFEYRHNAITHKPTGATWTTLPGGTECSSYRPSKLGVVLENGGLYAEEEVNALALT